MATIIYAWGSAEVAVPAGEKIAVFSNSSVKVYQQVGYPNHPATWDLLTTTAAGDTYTSAAFAAATTVRVEASAASAFYETGAAPSIAEPQTDITAADATFTINGLAAAQGGYVRVIGGASSTSGNAGGAAELYGGAGGATGAGGAVNLVAAAGGATSGTGGAVNLTAGAGTNGDANGGSIVITPGAKNGTGADGVILERGVKLVKQGAQTAKTVSATLTAAEILAGIITVNQAAGGASAQQLPLATAMDTALPESAAGDAFDFSVINISVVAAEDATLTTNTGWTLVGNMEVQSADALTNNTSGRFRARKTGAGAWTLYRLC
jgi:hypothetical protein